MTIKFFAPSRSSILALALLLAIVARIVWSPSGARPSPAEYASALLAPGAAPPGFGPRGGEFRDGALPPPAEMAKFMEARLAKLPAGQQEKARAHFAEMQKTMQEVQALPEEKRADALREKMEQRMSDPGEQQQMEERMAAHEAQMTPEQRHEMYRSYVQQKNEAVR